MIIALFAILFCIYLFFGLYILSLNYRNRLNQVFFIISLFFCLTCLGSLILQTNITDKEAKEIYPYNAVFYNIIWYLILVFNLNLTKIIKLKWYAYLLLSFPMIYLVIEILNYPYTIDYLMNNNIRYLIRFDESIDNMMNKLNLVVFFYFILSIAVLIIGFKRRADKKTKRQIIIVLISQILCVILAFVDHVVLFDWFEVFSYRIPGIVLIYSLLWLFGVWISLIKYRLMAVTPASVSNEIISNIDESLILLNPEMNILTLNEKLIELIKPSKNCRGKYFSCLIAEYNKIEEELIKLRDENLTDLSCRLNFINSNCEKIYMDAKIKIVKDKFQDIIGYLIIANEVKELKQLRFNYKITRREATIIQLIITGKTNPEIAEELKITERTVKTHITHIFNKLCVDNRIQLMVLLKDFNLLPKYNADKMIISRNNFKTH